MIKLNPLIKKWIVKGYWHEEFYHNHFDAIFNQSQDKLIKDAGLVLIERCIELEKRCLRYQKYHDDIVNENQILREQIKKLPYL